MRLRERTAPADGAAADAWSIEAGVGFDVSSSAEGRWRYHGDVKGSYAAGGVLTPHGFGYSQSAHAEPQRPDPGSESADGGESSAAKGRLGWSWSYYGGWRDGEQHGPAHLLFHDGSYFVGNLSRGVPRRGFFGLPTAPHCTSTAPTRATSPMSARLPGPPARLLRMASTWQRPPVAKACDGGTLKLPLELWHAQA